MQRLGRRHTRLSGPSRFISRTTKLHLTARIMEAPDHVGDTLHRPARDSTEYGSLPENQHLGRVRISSPGAAICRRYCPARKESPNPGRSGGSARRSVRGARPSGGSWLQDLRGTSVLGWIGFITCMIDRRALQASQLKKCLSPPAQNLLRSKSEIERSVSSSR